MKQVFLSVMVFLLGSTTFAATSRTCNIGAHPVDTHRKVNVATETTHVLVTFQDVQMKDGNGQTIACQLAAGEVVVIDKANGAWSWVLKCGNPLVGQPIYTPVWVDTPAANKPCPPEKPCEPEVRTVEKIVTQAVTISAAPKPFWFVPVSLFHYDGPGVAAGIGYQFKNRWSLMGQVLYGDQNSHGIDTSLNVCEDAFWDDDTWGPDCLTRCKDFPVHAQYDGGTRVGGMVTLTMPLGKH